MNGAFEHKAVGKYVTRWKSPLGWLILASDGDSLVGLWFEGQKHFGSTLAKDAIFVDATGLADDTVGCNSGVDSPPVFEAACQWLEEYFSGKDPKTIPLIRLVGTEFQRKVWHELLSIRRGTTITYGELARRLGSSARAVGSAVGRNPISIIVPCHRVTGSQSLIGYAAGLDTKRALLTLESRNV